VRRTAWFVRANNSKDASNLNAGKNAPTIIRDNMQYESTLSRAVQVVR
jgi:hypothetical protein